MNADERYLDANAAAAWRRASRSIRCLFADLADLDEAGGMDAAAEQGCWSAGRRRRSVDWMNLLRRMLRAEVGRNRGGDDPA